MNTEIQEWLQKQPEWIQEAAFRLLIKGTLDSDDHKDLAALLKGPPPQQSAPRTFPGGGPGLAGGSRLRLISIGSVEGIDALNPRVPLEFGVGNLAVIYGSNGSGKSGYTRVLSRACGKPHGVALKSNVYRDAPTNRKCTLNYDLDGTPQSAEWDADGEPIEDLRSVDVFDTKCGRIYLEHETELSYSPPDLTLFAELVEASKSVEAILVEEQGQLVSQLPGLPNEFASTDIGSEYLALSHNTKETTIAKLVSWSDEDEVKLATLANRLSTSDPAATAKKRRVTRAQCDEVRQSLLAAGNALSEVGLGRLRQLKEQASTKRGIAEEGARAMGEITHLEGVGTSTWRALWEAARAFSDERAYPDKIFPNVEDGARCVLCHQDLDDEGRKRLSSLESFVLGQLEADAQTAERDLSSALDEILQPPSASNLQSSILAAEMTEEGAIALLSAWEFLGPQVTSLRSGEIPDGALPIPDDLSRLIVELEARSRTLEDEARQFEEDATTFDRNVAEHELLEMEARKWISQQSDRVRAEIDRKKRIREYEGWKNQTNTTGISRMAGSMSQRLISDAYIDRFNAELKKLGAHKINVELVKTRTSQGRSRHSVRLREVVDSKAKISEVLSEGENRIVALAAFLADVTGRSTSTPFIFDDPISSLDQVFEEKVIDRLIELSADRQVIVFTHRLSFLGIMCDHADGEIHEVHIRREPWGTGQPGEVPIFGKKPDKALNSLKGERVARARKVYETEGSDAYYIHAKSICSDFRILMERLVETVFLADVVQRHRRSVNTLGKIGNLVKIQASDCDLIDAMMTKYSCYEHSQSMEAPVDVPDPQELEIDVQRMIDWHKEFTNRPAA